MALQGFDIANVNGSGIITRALAGDFTICKASEGLGFVDGMHDGFVSQLRAAGKLVGHYHYAHIGNDPVAEARAFLSAAKAKPGDVMVLDFEPYGQVGADSIYARWILAFCRYVNGQTGARCWLYANDDMANRAIAAGAQADCDAMRRELPLWKAAYASTAGGLHGWSALTAWQYSDQGIDQDTFYGDASTWAALAVPGSPVAPQVAPVPTPAPPAQPQEMFTVSQYDDLVNLINGYGKRTENTERIAGLITGQELGYGARIEHTETMVAALAAALDPAALARAVAASLPAEANLTQEQVAQAVKDALAASVKVTGSLSVTPA